MPGNLVCDGAQCKCSGGSSQASLKVTQQSIVKISGKPIATVEDRLPASFIPPALTFGQCKLLPPLPSGPAPCVPAFLAPWSPGSAIEKIQGMKVLTKESELSCAVGGKVSITDSKCAINVTTQ